MSSLIRHTGHPLRTAAAFIQLIAGLHLFTSYIYDIVPTAGPSMLPTILVLGDWMLVDKRFRRGRGVEVGDIVSSYSVVEPGEQIMKRVIGMEGDYVLRNTPGEGGEGMLMVPKGHCWVVGDNFPYSRDSRHFGPLPMALIRGKVVAKVFPWRERRWIEDGLEAVQ
ncbi:related to IMP1 Protease, mitochondrial [Rhynchosporium agropyri]|uniref:Related to IMP1 Protease, mitochondrial n=1 Tax=Rhynchosporium agropyri TaxID=914238 RepID=A0A1E1KCC2_9HELO|nr:related to IMP1 Protease, mitochondrial [Rhynchosporium agropyri]